MNRFNHKAILLLLVLASCTVHKDKDDQSFLSKVYHNTTARYNGYFNADLLMQESMAALNQEYVEDYDTLIPVYPYMANPNVENQFNTLDKVIEKVTTVSSLHRQSHWLDDNYLMLGKAQFLKKNYKDAGAAFMYLVNNFDPVAPNEEARNTKENDRRDRNSKKEFKQREKEQKARRKEIEKRRKQLQKERKKARKNRAKSREERNREIQNPTQEASSPNEPLLASASPEPDLTTSTSLVPAESNPDNYFMKHKPAYQEGLLWEARTWTAQENYFSAEARLSLLAKDPNTSEEIRNQALVALIDSYVKSEKYPRAIEVINETLEQNIDQSTKIRLAFLAGQISERLNSNQQAIQYFEKVIDYRPAKYEVEFFAQLNITRLKGGDLIGQFERLLKNPNNAPYHGQIYYTMGKTYRDNYDYQRAIDAFKNVDNPEFSVNPSTKAKAFMAIADISYEIENYPEARNYYTQALGLLSPEDSRHKRAKTRSEQLNQVVTALETIKHQDSLLLIAEFTDEQKKELALQIKKDRLSEQEEAAGSGSQSNTVSTGQMVSRYGGAPGSNVQSTFFAYNEKAVTQGQREFNKVWGDRRLADNWRYSRVSGASVDDSMSQGRIVSLGITQTEIDEILQEVPSTPEEKEARKQLIDQSMLKLGFAFRSDLNEIQKSNETLIELIDRQPAREIHAEALYLLFVNAREVGDNVLANQYKNQFDTQFGDTEFANQILTQTTAIGQEGVGESALKQVKKDYENGNFENVLRLTEQARTMFEKEKELLPQFAMLEALATGKLEGREAYLEKLKYIVANYGSSPEAETAREYLQLLGADVQTDITARSTTEEFSTNIDNTPHYILVLAGGNQQINPLKASISDFNKEFFQNDNVSISTVQISTEDGRAPAILIRRFDNKDGAMRYYDIAQKNMEKFQADNKATLLPLAITNYRFLITENKLPQYRQFLSENYGITN